MTTFVIYSSGGGQIESHDPVYANARSGANLVADTAGSTWVAGQDYDNEHAGEYTVWQAFEKFDTSVLNGHTLVDADLELAFQYSTSLASPPQFMLCVYLLDWGAAVTTADWVAGASLSGLTQATPSAESDEALIGLVDYYSLGGGAAFAAQLDVSGTTRLIFASSEQEDDIAPTENQRYFTWTSTNSGDFARLIVETAAGYPKVMIS